MTTAIAARRKPFVGELLGRSDYAIIGEIVEPNTMVLDLGCGEGELLEWLAENKGVDARGVEMSGAKVQRAIARGVSVYQGDIDDGLADYPDNAFDYVILSQTLQETRAPVKVLREMLRVDVDAIHRQGAQDQAVPARLVRFAQYSRAERGGFRIAGR